MSVPSALSQHIDNWVKAHPFLPVHVDCTTTVMLKILDGKCKMTPTSKVVMEQLYDSIKHQKGILLEDGIHRLILNSRNNLDQEEKLLIYEQRLLAETIISRPVMKAFKAMIKAEGLFDCPAVTEIGNQASSFANKE